MLSQLFYGMNHVSDKTEGEIGRGFTFYGRSSSRVENCGDPVRSDGTRDPGREKN
jgi:hypothetical protein